MALDPWFLENLICPVDGGPLTWDAASSALRSAAGRTYPVIEGVPQMRVPGATTTVTGLSAPEDDLSRDAPWYVETVLVSPEQKQGIRRLIEEGSALDPVATYLVAATNGLAYAHLVGKLAEYPIPDLRLEQGEGELLLDIGCSWGRWCIAAARRGYQPVGIDPSLGAVMAARRICARLGVPARFIVGDARHLPLRTGCFDRVFSYSVIQHFSPEDAARTIGHIGRVLKPGGESFIQMPNRLGLRCLYNQARRRFREARGFEVRYWSLRELRRVFEEAVGRTSFSTDCFFGIGWQPGDARFMPPHFRIIIAFSELLRRASRWLPPLTRLADSVYVASRKGLQPRHGGR